MTTTVSRSAARTTARGLGLLLLGLVVGATVTRAPLAGADAAEPARAPWSHERPIRAIAFDSDDVVLVESGGVYFVVNARGAAAPVRFRTTDLTNPPGESALMTP